MRVTNTLTSHRTFATNVTSESHKGRIVPDSSSQIKTASSLQFFKGVGPARAAILARMGLSTLADLLHYYPRGWEDRRSRFTIRNAPLAEKVTLKGKILTVDFTTTRSRLGVASASIQDASGKIDAIWFKKLNPRYDVFASLRNHLKVGMTIMVFGPVEWGPSGRQIRVEDMAILAEGTETLSGHDIFHFERIVPLYTVPEGMSDRLIRSLMGRTLTDRLFQAREIIPDAVRQKRALRDRQWALAHYHFPSTLLEKEEARQTLAFEEFFVLESALGQRRQEMKKRHKSHRYELHRNLLTPFREHLGFDFTAAQKRVIREIFEDLFKPEPMNRLLQGDVGSGKTLVALSAMLLAVENGGQAALMAPTEILAEQHALTFVNFLKGLSVRVGVLSGRMSRADRATLLKDIEEGKVHLIIGTHALIQKHVHFHRLMLAIIDEQHRFGVEHRSLLRDKGGSPDVLVMTATPIPRTLAMTLYGDLDVSVVDQLPPGRSPIVTYHLPEEAAYQHLLQSVRAGRQAYVVYPLVSESDKVELKAAVQEATRLTDTVFTGFRVGLLHGQLKARDKEFVMEAFRKGDVQILIATSIIEVGIDVPNATVMLIQHAERFGLATLHQLRGRVGRGTHASSCLLVTHAKSDDARRRIKVMTETTDGFRVSEEDLELRGPGEVLGSMQHGIPLFKAGDLVHDLRLIQASRLAAEAILSDDPLLRRPAHAALRQAIRELYGQHNDLTA